MSQLVAFGELMLRLSPTAPAERLFQSPGLQSWFGGSEANVAVGYRRLGGRAELITALPDSPIGDAALAALRAEGVGTACIARPPGRLGIYFVERGDGPRPMRVVYDREGSVFRGFDATTVNWNDVLDGARWLHVSGITPALSDGLAEAALVAVEAAHTRQVPVSVDLNWRPALWAGRDPRVLVTGLVRRATVVIGNLPAVRAMLGAALDSTDPHTAANEIHRSHGVQHVAITQRDTISASRHRWRVGLSSDGQWSESRTWDLDVVDRVGGGDACTAGLLFALAADRTSANAVEFAAAAGALKLSVPGDWNRVSSAEVDAAVAAWRAS